MGDKDNKTFIVAMSFTEGRTPAVKTDVTRVDAVSDAEALGAMLYKVKRDHTEPVMVSSYCVEKLADIDTAEVYE